MPSVSVLALRERAVRDRLARVMDPELDEPITEMGFVERVRVTEDGAVEVEFRLPTYWCSPNFAFLMADGIQREVGALAWTTAVAVRLHDHLLAEEVNAGVQTGRRFAEIFAEHADGGGGGDLGEIRAKFEDKAFQRRQEAVLQGLLEEGHIAAAIAAMDLRSFDAALLPAGEPTRQKPRYRALLVAKGLAALPDDLAFRTVGGKPLAADTLPAYLAGLRSVRRNMEMNGALCRGLSAVRYRTAAPARGRPRAADAR
jgi:metal-sulfur cluster biosynthetic enzyme